jgi:hypothetical protein
MPQTSYGPLYQALLNNVVEVRFVRRRQIAGLGAVRRMLCTNNATILTSPNGRIVLNYRTPANALNYNPAQKNLIITWDILMQDFRTISLDDCEIVRQFPPNDEFWNFFNETIFNMTTQQKFAFMQS